MKTELFYFKNDMHVRPMRFSILYTATDSSDKAQLMCSTVLLCLFASKYCINGSRLNSTAYSNKFKYTCINTVCTSSARTKRDYSIVLLSNTFTNKIGNLYI